MDEEAAGGGRVAFFGGSFDPPHMGHLAVARAACSALRLDAVLFAPVGAQPLKPQGASASFADRLAMTCLALAGEAGFEVSLADAPRFSGEPNYTLDTLRTLLAELGQEGALFCLMGADAFAGLKSWHGAAALPFVAPLDCCFAARVAAGETCGTGCRTGLTLEAGRDGERGQFRGDVTQGLLRNLAGETAAFYLLPGLHVDVSASEIRRQVQAAHGQPCGRVQ